MATKAQSAFRLCMLMSANIFSSMNAKQHFEIRLCVLACCLGVAAGAKPLRLTVQTDAPGTQINPAMWGIFFEDINFGADGGLYAEMVKNRGFEFPEPLMGWSKLSPGIAAGRLSVLEENPCNAATPHYLRIESEGNGLFGVANEGFRGMGVRQNEAYDFSARVRAVAGMPRLRIELYSSEGALLESAELKGISSNWEKYRAVLRPSATDPRAKLYLLLDGKGSLDLDLVSLFPERTWKNRPGGLRADMVQMLADLKPGFLRFPGGCIVEGSELARRYQWKKTIGPVEERPLLINRWNYEFLHRPAPDYFQSFGLGFFEFFQLCEDIGAQPLPILNCGMACQFNSGELCPLDQLDPYIQDALDLIEFANGSATTVWGAKRASMGHPAPFNLKLLGIGNEQWDRQYIDRYARFHRTLKEKYPEVLLVSSAGPSPDDRRFNFAWPELRELKADIVDEHCYAQPEWFFNNTHRYDNYDRKGPKVFMGEYAAQSDKTVSVRNRNDLQCALAEAAYMIGLERNADVVRMASYAPLFAHTDAWQWRPNLIWTDNLRVYGTPSYYAQQLFSRNRGDVVLPVKFDLPSPNPGTEPQLYASAARDGASSEVILKVVNPSASPRDLVVQLEGVSSVRPGSTALVLTGDKPSDENSFDAPLKVSPRSLPVEIKSPLFNQTVPPRAFMVLRIKV
jgi:alpha-L-arabinofuranosidase